MEPWQGINDGDNAAFSQYVVAVAPEEDSNRIVRLMVWAESIDNALACGEVLSAVYLVKNDIDW